MSGKQLFDNVPTWDQEQEENRLKKKAAEELEQAKKDLRIQEISAKINARVMNKGIQQANFDKRMARAQNKIQNEIASLAYKKEEYKYVPFEHYKNAINDIYNKIIDNNKYTQRLEYRIKILTISQSILIIIWICVLLWLMFI